MKKPTPHVVLLLGTHVPSVFNRVGEVIEVERPSKLAIELLGSRDVFQKLLASWRRRPEVQEEHFALEYGRRLHNLAKSKGVSFDFLEQLNNQEYREVMQHYYQLSSFNEATAEALSRGDVDRAVNSYLQRVTHMLSTHTIREASWTRNLIHLAKASSRPVMVLAGAGHASLAKTLADRGVKVTVYSHDFNAPATNAVEGAFYRNLTRGMVLKAIFRDYLFDHFKQRYNLSDGELPVVVGALPGNEKLRMVTSSEIESFFGQLGISAPVRQRANLEALLARKGFNFPPTLEVERLKREVTLPPFRKIKVFEPNHRRLV